MATETVCLKMREGPYPRHRYSSSTCTSQKWFEAGRLPEGEETVTLRKGHQNSGTLKTYERYLFDAPSPTELPKPPTHWLQNNKIPNINLIRGDKNKSLNDHPDRICNNLSTEISMPSARLLQKNKISNKLSRNHGDKNKSLIDDPDRLYYNLSTEISMPSARLLQNNKIPNNFSRNRGDKKRSLIGYPDRINNKL